MALDADSPPAPWVLYLLLCSGERIYAGITNDLGKRMADHASGKGARFTRAFKPEGLLAVAPYPDRAAASRAEWQVKRLPRDEKLTFVLEAQAAAEVESGDESAALGDRMRG